MLRIFSSKAFGMTAACLMAVLVASPNSAEAKRYRHHGSSGSSGSSGGSSSSHGSSGSSGGSYSCHGSSGSSSSHGSSGSSGSSSSHGSSGSSGGWYSSHGSSGSSSSHGSSGSSSSHGSSGSSSSHGSSGSSGGVVITHHVAVVHAQPVDKAAKPLAPPAVEAAVDRSAAMLIVKVPADATVYLVDQKMSLTGVERKYRIPHAETGKDYTYPIRVEIVRNGKTLVSRSEQKVRAGQRFEVAVAESADAGELVAVAKR